MRDSNRLRKPPRGGFLDWKKGDKGLDKQKAIFVKWDLNGATEIISRLEKKWWIDVSSENTINVITYKSPDGRWSINMRDISSSEKKIYEKGYKVNVTLGMW